MPASTIDCSAAMQQLWDYLDGEVDQASWDAITTHLSSCTGCRSHVEFARSFLTNVAASPVRGADVAALKTRVVAALREG